MSFSWKRVLVVCLSMCVMAGVAQCGWAQTFSASITGTVTDPSGGAVQATKIRLRNMDTNDTRETASNATGLYRFDNLLPGTYEITAEAPGFKSYVQSHMILRAATAATLNISLAVGGATESVQVTAEAVLLDTESANNSVTLDQVLIQNLPNSTRNPLNFVYNLAGTTEAQGGMTSRSQTFDQLASTFGINGGRSAEAEILIDGAPSTAIDWGGLMVAPIQDSVQEQQVLQNGYDAQYSGGGEGVVTLVTRNGSDRFHGEVYDYMRNSALDANTWSNDNAPPGSTTRKPLFHRNQFGANLGGPLWRSHHVYFFAAYEGLRQPGSLGRTLFTVPTALERQGDFSQTFLPSGQLDVIYNPFTTRPNGSGGYTRDPYPGNKITGGLDPVGQKLVALYPLPNLPGEGFNHINNFAANPSNNTSNDKFDWRIDWAQSSVHRLFVRMSDRVRESQNPGCFFCTGGDPNNSNNIDHGYQVAVNDTVTPSPNWVIDSYAAASRWWEGQNSITAGAGNLSKIGLSPSYSQAPLLPLVNMSGSYSQLGSSFSSYQRYVRYLYTGILNLTKQQHAHTLKFGFNYDVAMINIRQDAPLNLSFSSDQTSCDIASPPAPTCQVQFGLGQTGNPIASMLLGVGSGGNSTTNMDPAMSQHTFGVYFQDNWRATQNLTVFVGLRYENQRPATERFNRVAYFDPNAVNSISTALGFPVKGAFEYAGVGGRSRYAWEPDNRDFGPRVGLAYRVTSKLAARAGTGIFFAPTSAMIGYDDGGQSPGYTAFTPWVATQNQQGYIPANLVSNPFPNGLVQPVGNSQGDQTLVGIGAGQVWLKAPHPVGRLYEWSADVQYEVSPHAVLEVGYTGVRGRKLLYGNPNLDYDQLPTAELALGPSLNDQVPNPFSSVITDPNSFLSSPTISRNLLLRPFPAFGFLQLTRSTPGASSQFDALNVKFNHSFSNGLDSITTYQWSKNLDNGSEARLGWTGVDTWRDATNTKLDYSLSAHDVPQSFAEALVYQLPYGSHRRWGSAAPSVVRQIVGGWDMSAAIRLGSGLPLPSPVSFQNNDNPLANYGFPGPGYPDVIGDPQPQHRNKLNWINPAAFQASNPGGTGLQRCDVLDPSTGLSCQPFSFRYGNEPARMNHLREAANKSFDMGVAKQFGTERLHAEFRADFLNIFNHPIYGGTGNISTCINCGDLGTVYGTRNDPRNIQLSLKLMF